MLLGGKPTRRLPLRWYGDRATACLAGKHKFSPSGMMDHRATFLPSPGCCRTSCGPCKSDLPSGQTCFFPSSPSRGGCSSSLSPALPVCNSLGFAAARRGEGKAAALGANKAPKQTKSLGVGALRGPAAGPAVFRCHHPEPPPWKGLSSASPACAFAPPASPPLGQEKNGGNGNV